MFKLKPQLSMVTTVLPAAASERVLAAVIREEHTSALVRQARGTLLHDRWWKSWVPPISPSRTMLQMLVPDGQVNDVMQRIVEQGNLHLQAAGAVFSTPCDTAYMGADYASWPGGKNDRVEEPAHQLNDDLSAIYCVVGHQLGDRIAKAAIRAGAHGPVVYYVEGRGLRDRLGWLRITRDTEQEVLMVIAETDKVEDIFDAMAKAGELHLPGRGIMYRMKVGKGMFNLPSRTAHHHYEANMQQIISAIDHLAGHSHWRDQAVVELTGDARAVGLDFLKHSTPHLFNQVCLSASVNNDASRELMNLMLEAGAPGLNLTHARKVTPDSVAASDHASLIEEQAIFRCITDETIAAQVCAAIEAQAEQQGLTDLCVTSHSVPRVARYIPTSREHRRGTRATALAS